MTEEKKAGETEILMGEPITIKLLGKDISVKRLTFTRQMEALSFISSAFSEANASKSHTEKIALLALDLVSHACEVSKQDLIEKGSLVETLTAFNAIWRQNGFDFLSETVAGLTQTDQNPKA